MSSIYPEHINTHYDKTAQTSTLASQVIFLSLNIVFLYCIKSYGHLEKLVRECVGKREEEEKEVMSKRKMIQAKKASSVSNYFLKNLN